MNLAFILGRTPDLAFLELNSVLSTPLFAGELSRTLPGVATLFAEGQESISAPRSFAEPIAELDALQKLQNRLGGTVRIVSILGSCVESEIIHKLTGSLEAMPVDGKLTFGISAYGKALPVERLSLSLKSNLKKSGRGVRAVIGKEGHELSSVQVIGNKLVANDSNVEIVLVRDGDRWLIGKTVTVQDINSYRKRDFDIPVPDPVSGMLSPKLAQTIVNIGVGSDMGAWVYDPFCGNGRVVEEAFLMGLNACGSDILEKQFDASAKNLEWMADKYSMVLPANAEDLLWQADATLGVYPQAIPAGEDYYIVTEPYLGAPLRGPLNLDQEKAWAEELVKLYKTFFESWAKQPKDLRPKGFCVVFPAAKRGSSSAPLSILPLLVDRLKQLGYSLSQVSEYGRPDAFVVRQIVRLDYSDFSFLAAQGK